MLGIIEYGAGNQTSVSRALEHLGIPAMVTADAERLAGCDGIIFPGVGSAGQAMERIRATGLDLALRDLVARKKPMLGICLGCQILLERSEEGDTATLGLLPGYCARFENGMREEDGGLARVPHMGWNSLKTRRESPLLAGLPKDAEFYFVHGYHAVAPEDSVIATSFHGIEFCAILGRDGLWGVQFHPEKSGRPGLGLLRNFYSYCQEMPNAV